MTMPEIYVAIVMVVMFAGLAYWFTRPVKRRDQSPGGQACSMPPEYAILQQRFQNGEITREEFEEAMRRSGCGS